RTCGLVGLRSRDCGHAGMGVRPRDPCGDSRAVPFSPDGRSLAVGRDQPGILIFDLAAGGFRTSLNTPLFQVCALAFSPDGRSLAIATGRDGRALLWALIAAPAGATLRGGVPARSPACSPPARDHAA